MRTFHITLELWVLRKKTTHVNCHSHHIISRVHTVCINFTVDIDLNQLAKVVFVQFLHWKVTLCIFLFQHCTHWKEVTMLSSHSGKFCFTTLKTESDQIRSVTQSCPTLCDPMDCSLPGSSVHGIFQARTLEWGAIAFSGIKYRHQLIIKYKY